MRLFAEELGDLFDHFRHPGHTTDQNNLVHVSSRQTSVFQSSRARLHRLLDQVRNQRFQLGTGQFHDHVQRLTVRPHRDERLVNFGLRGRAEFDLGFLGSFFQTLQGHFVLAQVDTVFLFELIRQVVDDAHVKVFTTQEGVTVGRFDLEQAVVDFQNGHVKGTTTKVINRDGLGFFLVQTIGQRGGCRFVDDPQHFQTGDLTGVLGGLTLSVVEVCRNGDNRLRDVLTQIALGGFLHLAQSEGRDLAWGVLFTAGFYPRVAIAAIDDGIGHHFLVFFDFGIIHTTTDQTLDAKDRVVGVGDRLTFCRLTDQTLIFGEGDDRGRGPRPFGVFDDLRLRAVHNRHTRVGGPKVNPDYFSHFCNPFLFKAMSRGRDPLWHPCPDQWCANGPTPSRVPAYIRAGPKACKRSEMQVFGNLRPFLARIW